MLDNGTDRIKCEERLNVCWFRKRFDVLVHDDAGAWQHWMMLLSCTSLTEPRL